MLRNGMEQQEYYRSFSSYLKQKYNTKVWRLPVDTGRSCPNRLNGKPGCSFCDGTSFLPDYLDASDSLEQQLDKGRLFYQNRLGVNLFLGYFQANTNTYGPIEDLLAEYEFVLSKEYIVGIIISTRPDYINTAIISEINQLSKKWGKEVWIELGLQSVYDKTLLRIHRGHSYSDFCKAVTIINTISPDIKIAAHMILGLPGESYEMIVEGNKKLFHDNTIHGVKYRPLDLSENTGIYNDYIKNPDDFLRFDDVLYVRLLCDIITSIPDNIIIMRFANYKSFTNVATSEAKYTKGTILRMLNEALKTSKENLRKNSIDLV
ncbi:MAG TPA: TIGR01212 family radical SAM protein [Spirochaetia bacterium]|nr:TIGR01212 family radical SAM protein [Spirochaetia bacterium]HBI36046.1 TIGR01212 family radical SAM protein [Spirochaetia bacterium]